jgi:hypothetical protein
MDIAGLDNLRYPQADYAVRARRRKRWLKNDPRQTQITAPVRIILEYWTKVRRYFVLLKLDGARPKLLRARPDLMPAKLPHQAKLARDGGRMFLLLTRQNACLLLAIDRPPWRWQGEGWTVQDMGVV